MSAEFCLSGSWSAPDGFLKRLGGKTGGSDFVRIVYEVVLSP